MRKLLQALIVSVFLSAPGLAFAQLQLGVRFGGALPTGSFEADLPLGDLVDWTLPVGLEVGWRFWDHLTVGAHGQYAFGFLDPALEEDCDAFGSTCAVSTIRVGIHALYAFRPAASVDPWLGVGIGFEWLRYTVENTGVKATLGYQGLEWVRLQGGLDFRFGRFSAGPYLSYGIGAYTDRSLEVPPDPKDSEAVPDRSDHGWIEAGARGLFTF
jgi:hypothetical protein